MIDLIRKRHPGEGWIMFEELANGTGAKVRGWADAAALGVWPSHKYELHGYEMKSSREDLKRDLRDPTKADNIGRYCHFWWLVLSEEKLMDGLVVPSVWGILVPRGKILRTVRKAPRVARPRPFDAWFCAAMIRNVTKTWVPQAEHARIRDATLATARAEAAGELRREMSQEDRLLRDLRDRVERFKEASGIDIQGANVYEFVELCRAVKAVIRVQRILGHQPNLADMVRREAQEAARLSARHRDMAAAVASASEQLNELAARFEADEAAVLREIG